MFEPKLKYAKMCVFFLKDKKRFYTFGTTVISVFVGRVVLLRCLSVCEMSQKVVMGDIF